MAIFIIIIVYLLFSIMLKIDKNKRTKKMWLIITFTILTVISAIRSYTVGADSQQYCEMFKYISKLNWNGYDRTRFEIGFFYLNKLISIISVNPQFFLAITSFLIIPFVGYFIYKYSKNVTLSTLLYILFNIYFFHMSALRQSIALVLLLFSNALLNKKKYVMFSIFVFLASLFHSSALIYLLVIVLEKFNYTKKNYVIIIAITLSCFVFLKPIFLGITNLLGKYSGYLNSEEFGVSNYFGALFQFILTFVVYTFCHILFTKKNNENNKMHENELFIQLLSLDVICQCMAMKMNIIGRMNQYFWIYSIVLIPNLITRIKDGKTRLLLYFGIILFSFIYWLIIAMYRPEWNGVIPYNIF